MNRVYQDLQFLGLLGIYRESFKLIFNLRKTFAQIALTLILPLSLPALAQVFVLYNVRNKLFIFILLQIFSVVTIFAFSLLSTSAVVTAVASFYSSREIRILSPALSVLKRLVLTLFGFFLSFAALAAAITLTLVFWTKTFDRHGKLSALGVVVVIVYAAVVVCAAVVWQMAMVVSVMEDATAATAVCKGVRLMRVKVAVGAILSGVQIAGFGGAFFVFMVYMITWETALRFYGHRKDLWKAAGFGGLLFLGLTVVVLVGLVVQTVFYFVCKSYHGESIDAAVIGDRPEVVYLGGNVPPETTGGQVEMGSV